MSPVALRGRNDGAELELGVEGDPAFALRTPAGGSSHPMVAVGVLGQQSHTLTAEGADASEDGTGRGTPIVAFAENQRGEVVTSDTMTTLSGQGGKPGQGYPAVTDGVVVRRLTPLECERLQGFPDGWTALPGAADSQRYKQLGNSVAVLCIEWVMQRLAQVDRASGSVAA